MPPKRTAMAQAANAPASTSEVTPRANMFKAAGLTIRVEENPSTKQHFICGNIDLDRSHSFLFFTK